MFFLLLNNLQMQENGCRCILNWVFAKKAHRKGFSIDDDRNGFFLYIILKTGTWFLREISWKSIYFIYLCVYVRTLSNIYVGPNEILARRIRITNFKNTYITFGIKKIHPIFDSSLHWNSRNKKYNSYSGTAK